MGQHKRNQGEWTTDDLISTRLFIGVADITFSTCVNYSQHCKPNAWYRVRMQGDIQDIEALRTIKIRY
jgi:hypothetical protein